MKGGDPTVPIIYKVEPLSSTNNFETHAVNAFQRGESIFNLQASYHRKEESMLNHQKEMPKAPKPETLKTSTELMKILLSDQRTPKDFVKMIEKSLDLPFPMEVRPVEHVDYFEPKAVNPPTKLIWMKAHNLPVDLNRHMHCCIAAFSSDWGIATTSLLPYGIAFPSNKLKFVASLDHSMWFHNSHNLKVDQWLLYEMTSIRGGGGRGMNFCHIYTESGELVVTAVQESLIRLK